MTVNYQFVFPQNFTSTWCSYVIIVLPDYRCLLSDKLKKSQIKINAYHQGSEIDASGFFGRIRF